MVINPLKYFSGYEISIINHFVPPPYGGGNQFLLALKKYIKKRRIDVGPNIIGFKTKKILFNSFNFDMKWLSEKLKKNKYKTIHRVDGPISLYRGTKNKELDKKIFEFNKIFAGYTVFQSEFSFNEHKKMGLNYDKNKVKIINNTPDPEIFNSNNKSPLNEKKIKIIASSWSSNERKGKKTYEWLDKNLDFKKYQFTFVGNINSKLKNIKVIKPKNSIELSRILQKHDIYITASENDPCSNALLEGLACGLPAVYLDSGGHSEIVKKAGFSFKKNEEIIDILRKIVDNYHSLQNKIKVPDIWDVSNQYLELFSID